MDDRRRAAASAIAVTRVGYGSLMALAPRRMLRLQTGDDHRGPVVWLARVFGVRDAVLGIGTLLATDDADKRRWVAMGAVADGADCLSAAAGTRWLGPRNSTVVAVTGGLAAATGAWVLASD